jgi:hypothetical protein
MARNMKMELHTFSLILYQSSFLDQTTSFETEVQEREPWDFYEWITCNEKPRCAPNIFPAKYENGVAYLLSYTVSVEKMWTQNACIIHDI